MKKKIIVLGISFVVIIAVIFAALFFFNNKSKKNEPIINNTNQISSNSKILVTYFSHSGETYGVGNVEVGNTKMMAQYIIDYLGADSFEIVPDKKYPEDYDALVEEAQEEQRNDIPVDYVGDVNNFSQYDVVFIGYPIWDGEIPNVVQGFIADHDFNGKTVIPFNTHEGSGNAGTYEEIKKKLSKATVLEDLAVTGRTARTEEGKEETIAWLNKLGFTQKSTENSQSTEQTKGDDTMNENNFVSKINVNINGTNYTATLEDNETTRELVNRLPLNITMSELNGNEKYYYFDASLPSNASRVESIKIGDIMLYGSDCIVIFYDSFSTPYSYTRIGKIENPKSLKEIVGKGNIEVSITK